MKRITALLMILLALVLTGCTGAVEDAGVTEDAGVAEGTEASSVTTSPVSASPDSAQEEAVALTLYAELPGETMEKQTEYLPVEEAPASSSLIAFYLADELSAWTGFDFALNDVRFGEDDVTVDWSKDSTLIAGLDDGEGEGEFLLLDGASLSWFMMDSLAMTLKENLDVTTVYYCSDGGSVTFPNQEEMASQGLPVLPMEQPYEGSTFFMTRGEGKGDLAPMDEEQAEESDVEVWKSMSGSYAWQESSQFSNATLKLKYLDNDCLAFELGLMEGSESGDDAKELVVAGVMAVDENGVGRYEGDSDAKKALAIDFTISESGQQVIVSHTGKISISPDGAYEFYDAGFEVTEELATSILEFLPTPATSLNRNVGDYTVNFSDELDDDGFYPVEVTFDDTGEVLAKFLIAEDAGQIFRVDDDIEPVLIFGS